MNSNLESLMIWHSGDDYEYCPRDRISKACDPQVSGPTSLDYFKIIQVIRMHSFYQQCKRVISGEFLLDAAVHSSRVYSSFATRYSIWQFFTSFIFLGRKEKSLGIKRGRQRHYRKDQIPTGIKPQRDNNLILTHVIRDIIVYSIEQ